MPCRVVGNSIVCTRGRGGGPQDRRIVERDKEWLRLKAKGLAGPDFEEWLQLEQDKPPRMEE